MGPLPPCGSLKDAF